MSGFTSCCLQTFTWGGTPTGKEVELAGIKSYVAGDNKDVAVLLIHDLFGWRYPNVRLLADHYAREIDATVYVPDFFGGWEADWKLVEQERFQELDLARMARENAREIRAPESEPHSPVYFHSCYFTNFFNSLLRCCYYCDITLHGLTHTPLLLSPPFIISTKTHSISRILD